MKTKKVLSLIVALAMVLSLAVPAFATTESEEIAFVKELGIMTGNEKGDFMADKDFTIAELMTVLARMAGADEAAAGYKALPSLFKDVADNHWAKGYTNWAAINRISLGDGNGNIAPSDKVSAERLAIFMLRALGYKVDGTDLAWTEAYDYAKENGLFEGVVVTKNGNVARGKVAAVVFNTLFSENVNGEILAVANGLVEIEVEEPVEEPVVVEPEVLEVKSVVVLNPKQIQITFGAPVDRATVIDANGDIINSAVQINSVSNTFTGRFNAANTVLTLTIKNGNWVKDTVYIVSVEGVKNELAEVVPAYATALKMVDTIAPSIVSATSVTNQLVTRNVTLTFSEPVQFTSVKVNGKFVSAVSADSGFGAVWTLTTSEDLDAGSVYTVEVNNLRDLFNNLADTNVSTAVTIVRDNVKPQILSVTPVNERELRVQFDKTMGATVNVDSIIVTKTVNGVSQVVPQSQLAVRSAVNRDTFTIRLAVAPFDSTTQTSKDITLSIKGLRDSVGNTMDAATAAATIVRDTVKPTVLSATQKPGTQDKLVVTFSEAVTKADGNAVDNLVFNLRNVDGTAITPPVTISGGVYNSTNNTIELTHTVLPASGSYRLVLVQNSIKDSAAVANYNDAQVVSFNYSKTSALIPQLVATINQANASGSAVNSDNNKRLEVTFSHAVVKGIDPSTGAYEVGAADNPSNYTVDGVALPAGTTITVSGGDQVVIIDFTAVAANRLPNALRVGGQLAVSVSNVKSVAGSTVQYTTAAVTAVDRTAPTMSAAYLTGSVTAGYAVTLQMSEKMSAVAVGEFVLKTVETVPVTITMTSAAVSNTNDTQLVFVIEAGAEADKIKAALDAGVDFNLATTGSVTVTGDAATVKVPLAPNTTGLTVTKYTNQ